MNIAHNMLAMNADRQFNINKKRKEKSTEKLSSGFRVNRAADDAAGLSISEKMRWQIRGLEMASRNVQDGISILQVADGALGEVHSILDRMKELSVQAANDTNVEADRQAIQAEIDCLIEEIDRIGRETEFNTKKVFEGGYVDMLDANGNPVNVKEIQFKDLTLACTDITDYPFREGSTGDYMKLTAYTTGGYTQASWNLIFGNGSTSQSTIRLNYMDDNGDSVTRYCDIENMPISNVQINDNGKECIRTFSYDAGNGAQVKLVQTIKVVDTAAQKYYDMNWKIANVGSKDVKAEFMFNADTAYNNDDHCEEYFINNAKVNQFCMYSSDSKYLGQSGVSDYSTSPIAGTNSFSIIDADNALPFSEKVSWDGGDRPDTVLIGDWTQKTGEWSYYDNLSQHLGGSTNNKDLAFSLIWNKNVAQGGQTEIKFKYGIEEIGNDGNVNTVPITYYSGSQVHTSNLDLWIQSGAKSWDGFYITIGEMNSGVLGLKGLDVTSYQDASSAISYVDKAIGIISAQRTRIGAFTNRLEHSKMIADNTAENTQVAESRIRDTDMAKEMVRFSKESILENVGQAMMAQANKNQQSIINLLQ